jgi:predicted O-methyltransferase YrrM
MENFGQINKKTLRWKLIQEFLEQNEVNTIVEIGTWKGMGSTLCILENKSENANFITLETDKQNYEIAKINLSDYQNKLKMINGRIIEIDEIKNFISDINLNSEQQSWLNDDLVNFENTLNVIEQLPEKIDFLLLDGGEFSTYPEWVKLKNRTKVVALDDIYVLKCNKIFKELSNDSNYEKISETSEGHGFSIFKKIS